jgi:hypothetical protein
MKGQMSRLLLILTFAAGLALVAEKPTQATLFSGDILHAGQCNWSPSGTRALCLYSHNFNDMGLQYDVTSSWCNGTYTGWKSHFDAYYHCGGQGTHVNQWAPASANAQADVQGDGNFVLYNGPGSYAVWATNTGGYDGAQVDPLDDYNLVVYYNGSPVWSLR